MVNTKAGNGIRTHYFVTRHDYLIIRLVLVYRGNENSGFESNKIVPLRLFN